jgi:hypothetical protein
VITWNFLRLGGLATLAVAGLVACGSKSAEGTASAAATTTTTSGSGGMTSGSGGMTGSGGSGGGVAMLNGCTEDMAEDIPASMSSILVTDASHAWTIGHKRCIKVVSGNEIQFDGVSSLHPLAGGSPGAADAASAISMKAATANAGATGASVKLFVFKDKGANGGNAYPYHCTVHGASMQGVVYVKTN